MSVYVPLAEFRRAVEAYVALVSIGACEVVAMAPAYDQAVCLYIDEGHELVDETLTAHAIQIDLLSDARDDIQDTLAAATSRAGPETFAKVRSESRPFTDETEDTETSKAKYELAANSFDVESLVRQVQLKAASKNPLLWTMEWELANKLQDDDFVMPESPQTFATFRVVLRPPLYSDGDRQELVFTMDQSDVRFAQRVLRRLDAAFEDSAEASP